MNRSILLLVSLSLGLTLAGCQRFTKTSSAVAGAGTGAVVGVATSSSVPIAAATGAGLGLAIHHFTDKRSQSASVLREANVQLIELGDEVTIVLPTDNLFYVGSARLKHEREPVLDALAEYLLTYGDTAKAIIGYTDNIRSRNDGRRLGYHQARRVTAYLWTQGVDWRSMHPSGLGKDNPIANNVTPYGNQQNRRIEIHFRKVS